MGDPYGSDLSEDEEVLDSLLLQAYTGTLEGKSEVRIRPEGDETEESGASEEEESSEGDVPLKPNGLSRDAILKGIISAVVYDHPDEVEEGEIKEKRPRKRTIDDVVINATPIIEETTPKKKGKRYYDELDLSVVCFNCGEGGHTQFECVEEGKKTKCRECGETGHIQYKCPNKLCYECLQRGHTSRDCPNRRQVCHRCGESGHIALRCQANLEFVPQRVSVLHKIGRASGYEFCFNCGGDRHTAADCGESTIEELIRYSRANPSPKAKRARH